MGESTNPRATLRFDPDSPPREEEDLVGAHREGG